MGDLDPHLLHGFLGQLEPAPKRHLDRFSRFCTAHERDRLTDTHADHATPCVAIGRYRYLSLRCGLIIIYDYANTIRDTIRYIYVRSKADKRPA